MAWLTPQLITLLLRGLLHTVLLTAVEAGVVRTRLAARPFLYRAAGIYVNIFRNIPALVLIIFLAFAVPNLFALDQRQSLFFNNLLSEWAGEITGLSLPYYALAVIMALTLNTSAYLAELFRAGAGTIPSQIVDAARSLGASNTAVFRQILLPQAVLAGARVFPCYPGLHHANLLCFAILTSGRLDLFIVINFLHCLVTPG